MRVWFEEHLYHHQSASTALAQSCSDETEHWNLQIGPEAQHGALFTPEGTIPAADPGDDREACARRHIKHMTMNFWGCLDSIPWSRVIRAL
jgi:hypothetical protein